MEIYREVLYAEKDDEKSTEDGSGAVRRADIIRLSAMGSPFIAKQYCIEILDEVYIVRYG